ncbi:hypothetical protein C1H46_012121 [Malus baccata]|uniref:Uncharacterized protein n=1 Tax=Malus baccata TaxID=106549 RepID=A0A540MV55_MALBA|nr:hypothetical protein C1H46_012121 [Malus baccata]
MAHDSSKGMPYQLASRVVTLQPYQVIGASEIPIPRPRKVATTKSSSSFIVAAEDVTMPLPLASLPATASLPELVREFEQIRTDLRFPRHPSKLHHIQE